MTYNVSELFTNDLEKACNIKSLVDDIRSIDQNQPNQLPQTLAKLVSPANKIVLKTLETLLYANTRAGLKIARTYAWFIDQLITAIFVRITSTNTISNSNIAFIATGGYGRQEMAPFSDIDILFLISTDTLEYKSIIETLLYTLWDSGFKVGHATRTIDECIKLAQQDTSIKTSLLDKRYLAGNTEYFQKLDRCLWEQVFDPAHEQFITDKMSERDMRHKKWLDSRYILEPDIKETKGGLRDLQTLFWITRAVYKVHSTQEMVDINLITASEAVRFNTTTEFLWTIRCALHFETGRTTNILTFDQQITLSRKMGYVDRRGQKAVERFMKRYFLIVKEVGDLTGIFCTALKAIHKKNTFGTCVLTDNYLPNNTVLEKNKIFGLRDARISLLDPEAFDKDPLNLLRIFRLSGQIKIFIHPITLRKIRLKRRLLDSLCTCDEANKIFLQILTQTPDPTPTLRHMNEAGVLGRFLPAFGHIVGMMQFNMYHRYTVDEHTLLAISMFHKISNNINKDFSDISCIAQSISDDTLMYIALLYHDIGKGREEDHSILGARIARNDMQRFNLPSSKTSTVVWLIEHHLLMSDTAQKRDISDPQTIRLFADTVKTTERLKMLYVLSVCDICAVGPDVWNNWKGTLLAQLYTQTLDLLTAEYSNISHDTRVMQAQLQLKEYWRDEDICEGFIEEFIKNQYPHYWLAHTSDTQLHHAKMIYALEYTTPNDPLVISTKQMHVHDSTEICLCTLDHAGIFSRMAGAIALTGANVIEARTFTTRNGLALATFWIQDADGTSYTDNYRIETLIEKIKKTLRGDILPRQVLEQKLRRKRYQNTLNIPASVTFTNQESDFYTLIEVNGRDRPGLLYELSRTLSENNIDIFSAVIATYGEHAVDVFYVKDLFGQKITSPIIHRELEQQLLSIF